MRQRQIRLDNFFFCFNSKFVFFCVYDTNNENRMMMKTSKKLNLRFGIRENKKKNFLFITLLFVWWFIRMELNSVHNFHIKTHTHHKLSIHTPLMFLYVFFLLLLLLFTLLIYSICRFSNLICLVCIETKKKNVCLNIEWNKCLHTHTHTRRKTWN